MYPSDERVIEIVKWAASRGLTQAIELVQEWQELADDLNSL